MGEQENRGKINQIHNQHHFRKFVEDFSIGALSATISRTATGPIERVKLVLQNQAAIPEIHPSQRFQGVYGCFRDLIIREGFWSLWRGNLANIIRYFPNQGLNFAFKERFKALGGAMFGKPNPKTQFWSYFGMNVFSGGLAGICSQFIIYPLDFARTRLGTDMGRSPAERKFTGMYDCMKKIHSTDGFYGLYRGFTFTAICYFFYRALYFGLYDTAKHTFTKDTPFYWRFMVAQASVLAAAQVAYPFDTLRRRLMLQSGKQKETIQYTGSVDAFRKVVKQEGILALYSGGLANVFRSFGGALVMVLFDDIHKLVNPNAKPTAGG